MTNQFTNEQAATPAETGGAEEFFHSFGRTDKYPEFRLWLYARTPANVFHEMCKFAEAYAAHATGRLREDIAELEARLLCNCPEPYFGAQVVGTPVKCERCGKEVGEDYKTLRAKLAEQEQEFNSAHDSTVIAQEWQARAEAAESALSALRAELVEARTELLSSTATRTMTSPEMRALRAFEHALAATPGAEQREGK